MAKRNNSTPWGYRKIFLKDQGREVFEPSDFIKEFTKPIEKELKKEVGKFPTVKSCLKPHLKRPYLFICDIEDAFGSVSKEFLYKTGKDTELRRYLEDDKYLVLDVLFQKFRDFMDEYYESVKESFFKDKARMNDYFDDDMISIIDLDFPTDKYIPYECYFEFKKQAPKWLYATFINRKKDNTILKIIGYKTYKKEIEKRLENGEKREDIIFDVFQPDKIIEKVEITNFLYLEFILKHIPIASSIRNKIKERKRKLFKELGDFNILTLIDTNAMTIRRFEKTISNYENYENMLIRQAEKFYFIIKEEYPEIDYFIENNINIRHYKKTGMKIHKKFAFLVILKNRGWKKTPVDDFRYWAWIEEPAFKDFKSYWCLRKFRVPVSNYKNFLDIFKKGGRNEERKEIYKYGKFYFTSEAKTKKINFFHEAGFGLIQGSNLSPLVFEFYCQRTIDRDLKKMAKEYKIRYTRYRDDLIFSSRTVAVSRKFRRKVRDILVRHFFFINNKKTKIVNLNKKGSSVKILGTILSKKSIDVPCEICERMDQTDELSAEYQGLKNWVDYVKSIY